MGTSKVKAIGNNVRPGMLAKSDFNDSNVYSETNPAALSPLGKGENNGQVGSAIDIQSRNTMQAKSLYNSGNQYSVTD